MKTLAAFLILVKIYLLAWIAHLLFPEVALIDLLLSAFMGVYVVDKGERSVDELKKLIAHLRNMW